ncbi:hypothetical protein [Candidatus Phytoplasma meliae]|uniref:Uncharacterized protein n=1 Tax=Candidatus Phytoplasma meliae TaxID=1848402 RepID=A0ABS5CXR7_9MOLU|nr:hypothetical protein [Candidatus Phytoplasma meliae]MBP5835772.1 hypothetical protein [Candidatus Phytoplasma meliae]MBP5836217.1 hypothetical protein [Candidatus Phytoplasma meliae]
MWIVDDIVNALVPYVISYFVAESLNLIFALILANVFLIEFNLLNYLTSLVENALFWSVDDWGWIGFMLSKMTMLLIRMFAVSSAFLLLFKNAATVGRFLLEVVKIIISGVATIINLHQKGLKFIFKHISNKESG